MEKNYTIQKKKTNMQIKKLEGKDLVKIGVQIATRPTWAFQDVPP